MLTATRFLRKELETHLTASDDLVKKSKEDVLIKEREITEKNEQIHDLGNQHKEQCEIQNHQVSILHSRVVK